MKLAINTETQAQFDALRDFHKDRFKKRLSASCWRIYKERTCVSASRGFGYADKEWHEEKGYTVIPFTAFAELAGMEWEEPKEQSKEEQIKDLLNKVIELIETK